MIEKTLEYIASNFQEPISLKILAKQANYSSFHFQRVFKSKTGETPKEYITRLRVQKASRELLLFPKKNIYSITIDCGFNSQSDFARTFKKFTGKSPTDFRNCEIEKTELQISELKQCIETKYCPSFNLVGNIINLSDESKIIQSFKELITWAMARELLQKDFMAYGVFLDSPYLTTLKKCRYYTAIKSYDGNDYEDKSSLRIERGKFASMEVKSSIPEMIDQSLFLKKSWTPQNGFSIKENALGFEFFPTIDLNKPYCLQQRIVHLPIQPK